MNLYEREEHFIFLRQYFVGFKGQLLNHHVSQSKRINRTGKSSKQFVTKEFVTENIKNKPKQTVGKILTDMEVILKRKQLNKAKFKSNM